MGHNRFMSAERPRLIHTSAHRDIYLRKVRDKVQLVEFRRSDANFNFFGNKIEVEGIFLRGGRLWDTRDHAETYLVKYLKHS